MTPRAQRTVQCLEELPVASRAADERGERRFVAERVIAGIAHSSMPTLPGTREASTGVPIRAASAMTFAPPSMTELTTSAWLLASQPSARPCGSAPSQR